MDQVWAAVVTALAALAGSLAAPWVKSVLERHEGTLDAYQAMYLDARASGSTRRTPTTPTRP